jgi:signal transduction histidine kinase
MSFRLKTILGIAAIEAILLLLLIWSSLGDLRATNEDALMKRANTVVHLFGTTTQDAVLSTDLATLESAVREVLKNPGMAYARVRGRQGVVLAEGGLPELLKRPFHAETSFDSDQHGMLDVAEDIVVLGIPYGRVEIGLSTGGLAEVLSSARQRMALIALMEMGLVALFSFALGTYLTRGLAKLQQASQHIAAGELSFRIDIRGSDELAETAQSFNEMSHQLEDGESRRKQAEAELARYQEHLEQLVSLRTAELTQANASLLETNHQLADAHSQLLESERMSAIGQLAAGVAHEINNPVAFVTSNMGSLDGYLQQLLALTEASTVLDAELSEHARQKMTTMRREMDLEFLKTDALTLISECKNGLARVTKIVSDLRDFACVGETEWQPYDLHRGLESTLNLIQGRIANAHLIKEYGVIPEVECLPSEINRVFMNLLLNAAQAILGHGQITVSTGVDNSGVYVSVRDSGCGIPAENLGRVFDPFFTSKPVGQGTGLGLSLAYGIVKRHAGRIDVQSELGRGSTFHVWIPIQRPTKGATQATHLRASASGIL